MGAIIVLLQYTEEYKCCIAMLSGEEREKRLKKQKNKKLQSRYGTVASLRDKWQ
jgi:hypothetical protein